MADDSDTTSGEELHLQPVSAGMPPRRRALWGALAAVALAAGALAVVSGGDDGVPRLPVALGASGRNEAAGAAADMSLAAWVTYVAGNDLPDLGGEGAAYRLRSDDIDEARVQAIADALGLTGDLTHEDRMWRVQGEDAVLEVYEDGGGTWWYSQQVGDQGWGVSSGGVGCEPGPAVDCAVAQEGTAEPATTVPADQCTAPDGATCSSTPETSPCPDDPTRCAEPVPPAMPVPGPECPPEADCLPPELTEPIPPADLPSKDEARQIALDLLDATGMDVDGAKVTVDGPYDVWSVLVEPVLDGVPVSGLMASVGVGSKGVVTNASGWLGTAERVGDYPLLDTRAAIDRLNEQGAGFRGGPVPMGVADDRATSDAVTGNAGEPCDDVTCTTMVAPVGPATTVVEQCKTQPDGSEICEVTGGGGASSGTDCVTILPDPLPAPTCPPGPPVTECLTIAVDPATDPAISTATDPLVADCEQVSCDDVIDVEAVPPVGADGAPETAVASPLCAEPVPYPEPEPVEVTLTGAERVLMLLGAVDGSFDTYLVPGYRFSGDDGVIVDAVAVADDSLAPTTTTTVPATPETTICETTLEEDSSGTTQILETCPGEATPGDGELRPLGDGEQPEVGVPYYVDLSVMTGHCSWVTVEFGGRWWWAELSNEELADWSTPTEGGTLTLTDPDHATFVGDAAGTKQATLQIFNDGKQPPGCA